MLLGCWTETGCLPDPGREVTFYPHSQAERLGYSRAASGVRQGKFRGRIGKNDLIVTQPDPSPLRARELAVAREIARAFLTASSPVEVYRTALGRLTPLVEASFASVFLRDDDDPRLLRLACAHNWPQSSARYLGELRIREGRGPTGQAVSERSAVEVPDVFADPSLEEWWEPARELGFVSLISLPLQAEQQVFGALSFYFNARRSFDDDARSLLGIAAHQLAVTADRAWGKEEAAKGAGGALSDPGGGPGPEDL